MIKKIKQILYFPVASYFKFFANIQLLIWRPEIVVITGSSSKTTILHLIQSALEEEARYSHHANSGFGIPFDILGLKRKTLEVWEWPLLFLQAPLKAFKTPFKEKLYIVEADCDRPYEGKFLSTLLKPEVTIWANTSNSHAQNFPVPVEENIAFEFGYFIENTKKLCIVNGDSKLIDLQLKRVTCLVNKTTKKGHLQKYNLQKNGTSFKIDGKVYNFGFLLPEDSFYSIDMCIKVLKYLKRNPNPKFSEFKIPPGRSSIFKGIKNTTIIDSSYNATPSSMKVILDMFEKYPAESKWLVLGDMVELGSEETKEHQDLAKLIKQLSVDKIIFVGPRLLKHTVPQLKSSNIVTFNGPREALDYINGNIKGGEVLLFKGSRFLEGIIENILLNKSDSSKLCRRETVWQKRRKKWGL